MTRTLPTESALLRGTEGHIEALIDAPETVRGIALVCHPHPLFGGANTNKVAHTLARTFRELGSPAIRPNFRGVGQSAGEHDHGNLVDHRCGNEEGEGDAQRHTGGQKADKKRNGRA